MPSVSAAQHRAMEAAAHGHSTLGIPKSVGEEFVRADDAKTAGAGVLIETSGGRGLFLKRGAGGDHPGEWCLPGGTIEDGESAIEAALREAFEEIGAWPSGEIKLFDRDTSPEGVDFTTFKQNVNDPFDPKLNDEHTEFVWAYLSDPPQPLHPGVERLLKAGYMPTGANDVLAFDRESVRTKDKDGRLHVKVANISKAAVNPYRGNEIPKWREMGLDPMRLYKLLRHPDELKKAAATSNNVQLLIKHTPVSADDHHPDETVGSTGTDAEFVHPYLRNSLVIWATPAIKGIEDKTQKELSSSYHYDADMTPGTYEGEPYDGVMRNLVFNHVALVKEGRAGSDVAVCDSAENLKVNWRSVFGAQPEEKSMSKVVLSRKAAVVAGALMAFLAPRMAADAKPLDITSMLDGISAKNFKEKKTAIVDKLKASTAAAGVLAKDANIEGVVELLDALEKAEVAEGADTDPNSGLPMSKEAMAERDKAADNDPSAAIEGLLKGKIDDETLAKVRALIKGQAADDPPPTAGVPKKPGAEGEDDDDKEEKVTKTAMDAAIAAAVEKTAKEVTETVTKNQVAIREAERAVRPYVGELAMAHDSAEAVYRTALTTLGVKVDGIHPSAFPALLAAQQKPGDKRKDPPVAMDAAGAKDFATRFPGTSRIQVL